MIRVLVVDDEHIIRSGLTAIIDAQRDLTVIGEACDGDEAVAAVARRQPDVVLMDIRMPTVDGITATERIVAGSDTPPAVLILTTFDLDEHVFRALRVGAAGFLVKDTPPERLLDAIRAVHAGDALLGPSITRRLIAEFVRLTPAAIDHAPDLDWVTPREREVITLVARGLDNREIAEQLYVSLATVKSHLARVMTKLNLSSRAQVVVYAYERGLATPTRGR